MYFAHKLFTSCFDSKFTRGICYGAGLTMASITHGELPGISCARDVKVACTSKSLGFFGRPKAISGGELKIALRRSELHRIIWWCLVVQHPR